MRFSTGQIQTDTASCSAWLIAFLSVICYECIAALKECKRIDQCRCATDEGGINLWSLVSTSERPRFNVTGRQSSKSFMQWNPCSPCSVPDHAECENVAACWAKNLGSFGTAYSNIGDPNTAEFKLDSKSGTCFLDYSHEDYSTTIALICSEDEGTVDPVDVTFERIYVLWVCCSVLAGGILINGVRGKRLIPHYAFWLQLFIFIKDGCLFTFGSCFSICSRSKHYEPIS